MSCYTCSWERILCITVLVLCEAAPENSVCFPFKEICTGFPGWQAMMLENVTSLYNKQADNNCAQHHRELWDEIPLFNQKFIVKILPSYFSYKFDFNLFFTRLWQMDTCFEFFFLRHINEYHSNKMGERNMKLKKWSPSGISGTNNITGSNYWISRSLFSISFLPSEEIGWAQSLVDVDILMAIRHAFTCILKHHGSKKDNLFCECWRDKAVWLGDG